MEVGPRVRVERGFEKEWAGASRLATECLLNIAFLGSRLAVLGDGLVRTHGFPSLAAFDVVATVTRAGKPLPPS